MSLILALGSNVGEKLNNLQRAKELINKEFNFIAESRVYQSEPVDYLDQDLFLNQVLEYKIPVNLGPLESWEKLRSIELEMGRNKVIPKGPRNIDIDIIFWGTESFNFKNLIIPHSSWSERSFVVKPLLELPFSEVIKEKFDIPEQFDSKAEPYGVPGSS